MLKNKLRQLYVLPRGPLVLVSSRSERFRKSLLQPHVHVFRLFTIVRKWCIRSLGRLKPLHFLLRHKALFDGRSRPRKTADEQPLLLIVERGNRGRDYLPRRARKTFT
jgi:hypothetical protein